MTSKAESLLTTLRDHLAAVPGIATSKIGLEAGISPDDYPIVRIVPSKLAPDAINSRRNIEALIYFGHPIDESESGGLEAVYSAWLTMEESLISSCYTCPDLICEYLGTITDEDRVAGYKMLALNVSIRG
jgi:hypothetical protein